MQEVMLNTYRNEIFKLIGPLKIHVVALVLE